LFVQWLAYSAGVPGPTPSLIFKKAIRFLEFITGPDGTVPGIGDWDDGYVFRPFPQHPRYVKQLTNLGRILTGLPFDCEIIPSQNWKLFPESGMAVHRRTDQGVLCFRAASVIHGHSHLDMLSLHYISPDGPIILDGGTYAYNFSTEIRNFYRSPMAHSTIFPEGIFPVKPMGTFAWRGKLIPRLSIHNNGVYGEYEIPKVCKISRKVLFNENSFHVYDICKGNCRFISQFIVPNIEFADQKILIKSTSGKTDLIITHKKGQSKPMIKKIAISNSYGKREDAIAIQYLVKEKFDLRLEFALK